MSFLIGSGLGGSDATVNDLNVTVSGSGTQTAAFRLSTDKSAYKGENGVFTAQWTWTSESPSAFDVRATLQSGTSPTGDSLGSWLVLSSTRTWTLTDGSPDDVPTTCQLLVEIRPTGGGATIDSGTINLSADRFSI